MIIVIAPERDIPNEISILNQLFTSGLRYYHFRKPYKTYTEHCDFLDQIPQQYHARIVTHYHHDLTRKYALKGVHLQEQMRWDQKKGLADYTKNYHHQGFTVSSSYHSPEELAHESVLFDYHLLSPVFSSISQKGYKGKGFAVTHISKKVVGMGGVNADTVKATLALGYTGVGVLGGIWNSKNPVANFIAIQKAYTTHRKT